MISVDIAVVTTTNSDLQWDVVYGPNLFVAASVGSGAYVAGYGLDDKDSNNILKGGGRRRYGLV